MDLMSLPLIIVQDILEQVALTERPDYALRQRLVNRLFDVEITKHVGRHRTKDIDDWYQNVLYLSRPTPRHIIRMAKSLQVRLTVENVRLKRKNMNIFQATVHAINEALVRSLANVALQMHYHQALREVWRLLVGSHSSLYHLYNQTPWEDKADQLTAENINHSVFIVAVTVPYPALYESILGGGTRANTPTKSLMCPLESVAAFGRKEEVILLLDAVIDPLEDGDLKKAFETAATRGNVDALEGFLDPCYGLAEDVEVCVKAAETAMYHGHHKAAEVCLRAHKAYIPLQPRKGLRKGLCITAAGHGNTKILRRCLKGVISPFQILHEVTLRSWPPVSTVRVLLEQGAKIRRAPRRSDCFEHSVFRGNVEVVQFFLTKGINLRTDYKDFLAFGYSNYTSVPLIQCLFDNGLSFDSLEVREYLQRAICNALRNEKLDVARWYEEVLMINQHHM